MITMTFSIWCFFEFSYVRNLCYSENEVSVQLVQNKSVTLYLETECSYCFFVLDIFYPCRLSLEYPECIP